MLRQLPRNKTTKHKLIISAVDDFFGEGIPPKDKWLKKNICLWIMGRKRGVNLDEEQQEALWYIQHNLADPEYSHSLLPCG